MHDTRLEERLRRALHEEADALPFTITVDDLNVRLAQRPRSVSRLGILSAAAAVVLVVGFGAILVNRPSNSVATSPEPTGPQASPSFPADLASLALLTGLAGDGAVVFEEERAGIAAVNPAPVQHIVGTVLEADHFALAFDCSGPGSFVIGWMAPGDVIDGMAEIDDCADAAGEIMSGGEKAAGSSLFVTASPVVSWRVVASRVPPLDRDLDPRSAGWQWAPEIDETTEHQRPLDEPSGEVRDVTVGTMSPGLVYQFAYVCDGPGDITISIGEPGSAEFQMSTEHACDGSSQFTEMTPGDDQSHDIWVTADHRAAWHIIGGIAGEAVAPSRGPLGAFAEVENTTILDEMSGSGAVGASTDLPFPAGTDSVYTLVMCDGGGELRLFDGTSTHVKTCDDPNTGTLFSSVPTTSGVIPYTIDLTVAGNWAIRFLAYDEGANPDLKFIPPAGDLSDSVGGVLGVPGCGLGFTLADGTSASDTCANIFPVIPADRGLTTADAELTFDLAGEWLITGLRGEVVSSADMIQVDGVDPQLLPLVDMDGGSTSATFAAPQPGDWMVILHINARLGDDTFSVPYVFRVVVQP